MLAVALPDLSAQDVRWRPLCLQRTAEGKRQQWECVLSDVPSRSDKRMLASQNILKLCLALSWLHKKVCRNVRLK